MHDGCQHLLTARTVDLTAEQELASLQPLGADARLAEVLAAQAGRSLPSRELASTHGGLSVPVEIRRSPFYTMLRYRALLLRKAYIAIAAATAGMGVYLCVHVCAWVYVGVCMGVCWEGVSI